MAYTDLPSNRRTRSKAVTNLWGEGRVFFEKKHPGNRASASGTTETPPPAGSHLRTRGFCSLTGWGSAAVPARVWLQPTSSGCSLLASPPPGVGRWSRQSQAHSRPPPGHPSLLLTWGRAAPDPRAGGAGGWPLPPARPRAFWLLGEKQRKTSGRCHPRNLGKAQGREEDASFPEPLGWVLLSVCRPAGTPREQSR